MAPFESLSFVVPVIGTITKRLFHYSSYMLNPSLGRMRVILLRFEELYYFILNSAPAAYYAILERVTPLIFFGSIFPSCNVSLMMRWNLVKFSGEHLLQVTKQRAIYSLET